MSYVSSIEVALKTDQDAFFQEHFVKPRDRETYVGAYCAFMFKNAERIVVKVERDDVLYHKARFRAFFKGGRAKFFAPNLYDNYQYRLSHDPLASKSFKNLLGERLAVGETRCRFKSGSESERQYYLLLGLPMPAKAPAAPQAPAAPAPATPVAGQGNLANHLRAEIARRLPVAPQAPMASVLAVEEETVLYLSDIFDGIYDEPAAQATLGQAAAAILRSSGKDEVGSSSDRGNSAASTIDFGLIFREIDRSLNWALEQMQTNIERLPADIDNPELNEINILVESFIQKHARAVWEANNAFLKEANAITLQALKDAFLKFDLKYGVFVTTFEGYARDTGIDVEFKEFEQLNEAMLEQAADTVNRARTLLDTEGSDALVYAQSECPEFAQEVMKLEMLRVMRADLHKTVRKVKSQLGNCIISAVPEKLGEELG